MKPPLVLEAEEKMKKRVTHVLAEFNSVRAGRVSASILDQVTVDYYGTKTPLKQVASITTPESHLLLIQPWDKTILNEIEKSILGSDLGVTPSNDGTVIRLSFPPLSEERRLELIKLVGKVAEEGRVGVRQVRRELNEVLKSKEHEKEISEDEKEKIKEEIQKMTDKYILKIDEILKTKEAAIKEV